MWDDQNGFYTARYGLKGCHRAVRTAPDTQKREKQAYKPTVIKKNKRN